MAEFTEGHLGKIDAKTTKVTWYPLPTAHARARRMNIDDHDRIVVTEYRGNRVTTFDTRAEKFTVYDPHAPHVSLPGQLRQERRDLGIDDAYRPGRETGSQHRPGGAIPDAVRHQHAHGVRRQHDDADDVLGRQQPRPPAREGRAARLSRGTDQQPGDLRLVRRGPRVPVAEERGRPCPTARA